MGISAAAGAEEVLDRPRMWHLPPCWLSGSSGLSPSLSWGEATRYDFGERGHCSTSLDRSGSQFPFLWEQGHLLHSTSRSTGDRHDVNGPGDVCPFTNVIPFHRWLSSSCLLIHPKAVRRHMGEPLCCHAGFCNTQTAIPGVYLPNQGLLFDFISCILSSDLTDLVTRTCRFLVSLNSCPLQRSHPPLFSWIEGSGHHPSGTVGKQS